MLLAFALACSDPPAGSLRTDREGLAERMEFPTAASELWWVARAAGRGSGRADAQINAWMVVGASARTDLTTKLGPSLGRTVSFLPAEVVEVIVPEPHRGLLAHNAEKKLYRLEAERFPPEKLGRPGYRGQVVLLRDDRLYVSLASR